MNIESDNHDIEKIIIRLYDKVIKEGAVIDDSIVISCKNRGLSILSAKPPSKEPLIKIPHHCLLPYDEFFFALEGRDIVLRSHSEKVSPLQLGLMEDMLELYNATGKLEEHYALSPWLALQKTPGILEILMQSRQGAEIEKIRKTLEDKSADDNFSIFTFFKNRLLGCKLYESKASRTKVLMPIVDCLNHHTNGAPFQNDYPDKGRSSIFVNQKNPVRDSRECYASYGRLDAMDTYLHYSFTDEGAPFVRSVPVDIDFGVLGTIRIRALGGSVKKADLPPLYRNLQFYMPIINVYHDERRAELSHIFIPGENARRSMRRILEFIILLLVPSINEIQTLGLVLQAERSIIDRNETYYNDLLDRVRSEKNMKNDSLVMVENMAKGQLKKINKYRHFAI